MVDLHEALHKFLQHPIVFLTGQSLAIAGKKSPARGFTKARNKVLAPVDSNKGKVLTKREGGGARPQAWRNRNGTTPMGNGQIVMPDEQAIADRINQRLAGTGTSVTFDYPTGWWRLMDLEGGNPRLIDDLAALAVELGIKSAIGA